MDAVYEAKESEQARDAKREEATAWSLIHLAAFPLGVLTSSFVLSANDGWSTSLKHKAVSGGGAVMPVLGEVGVVTRQSCVRCARLA